jgi:hypothetical protein
MQFIQEVQHDNVYVHLVSLGWGDSQSAAQQRLF